MIFATGKDPDPNSYSGYKIKYEYGYIDVCSVSPPFASLVWLVCQYS